MNEACRNKIVVASAGTGKTYRLVSEFVDAVVGASPQDPKIPPRAILALTFTEKAAAEMKTRISQRLSLIANDTQAIRELDQATITTYHSFCAKLLREYSAHIGIDRSFRLLDPFEDAEISKRVAKRVVLKKLKEEVCGLPTLVARIGVGGSKSSRGVADYLVRTREQLIESGILPHEMPVEKVLAFDEFIASQKLKEMLVECEQRFSAYSNVKLTAAAQEKIHVAYAYFAELKGVLFDCEKSSLEIGISSVFGRLKDSVSGRFGPDEYRRGLLNAVTQLGSALCQSFLSTEEQAFRDLLKDYWTELEREKNECMSLGFADLLMLTQSLLRYHYEVRKEVKDRFQKVLVDEYQDTSPIQEDIVALICESKESEASILPREKALGKVQLEHGKLFVVGDPKQSIYGFRGSDVTLFDDMANEIVRQDGKRESLTLSRRSSSSVVSVVNQAVPCSEDERLVALEKKDEIAGGILQNKDEARSIAQEVAALLSGTSKILPGKSCEPKDIAILVRRIKKAQGILDALGEKRVPARIFGGEGFFQRLEVVDLVSALQLVIDPNDTIALLTVLRSPLVSLTDASFLVLFEAKLKENVLLTLEFVMQTIAVIEDEADCLRFKKFYDAILEIQKHSEEISAQEALEIILEQTDYVGAISQEVEARAILANIEKLRNLLMLSESDFAGQVAELVKKIERESKEAMGEQNSNSNSVRIMTIHQSKGLEFPVVFVADTSASIPSESSDILFDAACGVAVSHRGRPISVCAPEGKEWQKLFPTSIQKVRNILREKNEKELSRLLYVGLTRAKSVIYFCDTEASISVSNRCTLRNLFHSEFQKADDSIKALMPVFNIEEDSLVQKIQLASGEPVCQVESVLESDGALKNRKLLFASTLFEISENTEYVFRSQRLFYQPSFGISSSLSSTDLGRLAHSLIQTSAGQLSLSEYANARIVRSAVETSLRLSQAPHLAGAAEIVESCATTLETVIFPLLKTGFTIDFEVPLELASMSYVVKGFADVVAKRGDVTCVIDFKSSTYAAKSDKTRLQLLTYCAALRKTAAHIYFASCKIGDSAPLEFQAFDEQGLTEIEDHLSDLAN